MHIKYLIIMTTVLFISSCGNKFHHIHPDGRSIYDLLEEDIFSPLPLTANAKTFLNNSDFMSALKRNEKEEKIELWDTHSNQFGLVRFSYVWYRVEGPAHLSTEISIEFNQHSTTYPISEWLKREIARSNNREKIWIHPENGTWRISIIRAGDYITKIILFLEEPRQNIKIQVPERGL